MAQPLEGWWVCGKGHVFHHGDEDWHADASQPEGAPTHCHFEDGDGEPCMDSTHLWGPFDTPLGAEKAKLEDPIVRWLSGSIGRNACDPSQFMQPEYAVCVADHQARPYGPHDWRTPDGQRPALVVPTILIQFVSWSNKHNRWWVTEYHYGEDNRDIAEKVWEHEERMYLEYGGEGTDKPVPPEMFERQGDNWVLIRKAGG